MGPNSKKESEDLKKISALFDNNMRKILVVESKDSQASGLPEKGMHLLITKADADQIKLELASLGYSTDDLSEQGFVASKELSAITFLYAKEKQSQKSKKEI